ncbi:fungal-specific transcription factor domain-containing protein [Lipomyces kononenkoae]
MAPTPPSVSVFRSTSASPHDISASSTSQSSQTLPSPSASPSNEPSQSDTARCTDSPAFNTGRLQSVSTKLSDSRPHSIDVKDQIRVFRLSPGSRSTLRNTPDPQSDQQKNIARTASRRTTRACERCHKRRTKCDGKYPECTACIKASVPCHYGSQRSGTIMCPPGYVAGLEERISWLERMIHHQFPELNIADVQTGSTVSLAPAQPKPSSMQTTRTGPVYRVGPEHYYYEAFRNPAETLDELAVHVGFLSLGSAAEQSVAADAPAEPRFIGSSSGLAVASSVNRIIKELGIRSSATISTTAEIRASYTKPPGEAVGVKSDGEEEKKYDPLVPPSSPDRDDNFWPPYEEALKLVRAGYEEIVFYPLLNSNTFMVYLQRSYQPDTMQVLRGISGWRLTFFLVCAIGAAAMGQRDKQRGYFLLAAQSAEKALMRDNIRAIRALLLFALYSFYDPEGASAWLAIGTAFRIAIALGFHRQSSVANLNLINQEMRKRVFWAIYSLDRVLSTILGRPITLHDRDIDITHYLDLGNDPEMIGDLTSANTYLTDVSIALHMVKLRQLATKILVSVHNATQWTAPSQPDERLLEDLHRSLDIWKANIPRITIAPERTRMRVEIEYHEHLMLLYRPSPMFPVPSASAIAISANSASTAIELYAILYSSFTNPPTFIACRGVFTAALTLVWTYFSGRDHDLRLLSSRTVVTSLETAKQCLMAGSRSWSFAQRCAEVLDHFKTVLYQFEMHLSISGLSEANAPATANLHDLLGDVPFDISGFSGLLAGRGLTAYSETRSGQDRQKLPQQSEPEVAAAQAAKVYPMMYPREPQPDPTSGMTQIPDGLQMPGQDIDMTAARREFELYNSKLMSEMFGPARVAQGEGNDFSTGSEGYIDGQAQEQGQGSIFLFEDFMDLV